MIVLLISIVFVLVVIIIPYYKCKMRHFRQRNKVHFYITRDKDGVLILWFGKPKRAVLSELWYGYDEVNWITDRVDDFHLYNLNPKDYANLKWEDEPVEVFINMED